MDIDLLAKMVKEVVMDHDSVTLPGMGSFVAELVPATFADRGYTILPPYRKLYFSPKQGDDNYLAALYAQSNNVPEADAARILEDFIAEMKEVLKQRKSLTLFGLGRLRATRENHFFFVADEDLDIYPAGYGLQPISLKTHEEAFAEVASVSAPARIPEPETAPAEPEPVPEPVVEQEPEPEPEREPEPEPVPEPEPEPTPVPEEAVAPEGTSAPSSETEEETASEGEPVIAKEEDVPEKKGKGKSRGFWRVLGTILLILLIIAMVALLALVVLGHVAPQWLDNILYSAEELEILHP